MARRGPFDSIPSDTTRTFFWLSLAEWAIVLGIVLAIIQIYDRVSRDDAPPERAVISMAVESDLPEGGISWSAGNTSDVTAVNCETLIEWWERGPFNGTVVGSSGSQFARVNGLPSFRLEPGEQVSGELEGRALEFALSEPEWAKEMLIAVDCENARPGRSSRVFIELD